MEVEEEEGTAIEEETPITWKKRVKMALPHAALYFSLFMYLMAGAALFYRLEYEADEKIQSEKLDRIKHDYRMIDAALREMAPPESYDACRERIFEQIGELSSIHEARPFQLLNGMPSEEALPPRWSRSSALLYALSILTTTGYSYAVPVTPLGQFLAIVYGLLGIPVMVLAAVDIGRFLSHIVLELYAKYQVMSSSLSCRKKLTTTTTAVLRSKPWERRSLKSQRKSSSLEETDEIESANGEEEEESEKAKPPAAKRLPLSINAGILLVFCMMGGVTYIAAGGKATFLEAFFVTFNLVANLTMSEMPSDLNHVLTLIYIFVFVTFGVAVLSMCAELAALELKDIFLKIHYFGRKIKFKRKSKKEQIEVEVKELLKIIEEIRRRYPDKERITSLDILRYMNEASAERAVLTERRDTIAFQPQTMEMLKFADEQDLEDRSASRLEEAPLIEKPPHKPSKLIDVLQFSEDMDLEHCFYNELRKHHSRNNSRRHQKRPDVLAPVPSYRSHSTIT
uniref:Ion transport 2 domain containing protein n=1 Tax=Haemonchus contortus TaxID=6289 RepID=A0A7I4XUD5_HAECO